MIRNWIIGVLITAVLVLIGIVGQVGLERNEARTNAQKIALHAGNIEAQFDTTRNVALENRKVAATLGDSLHMYERRVVQITPRRDALDSALNRDRLGSYAAVVRIDSLSATSVIADMRDTTRNITRLAFHVRDAPYTADAEVTQPVGDSARLTLKVALDPLALTAHITCAAKDANGVSAAAFQIKAPPWATVRLEKLEQEPEVCTRLTNGGSAHRHFISWSPLAIVVGRRLTLAGPIEWAAVIGTGIQLGR